MRKTLFILAILAPLSANAQIDTAIGGLAALGAAAVVADGLSQNPGNAYAGAGSCETAIRHMMTTRIDHVYEIPKGWKIIYEDDGFSRITLCRMTDAELKPRGLTFKKTK